MIDSTQIVRKPDFHFKTKSIGGGFVVTNAYEGGYNFYGPIDGDLPNSSADVRDDITPSKPALPSHIESDSQRAARERPETA